MTNQLSVEPVGLGVPVLTDRIAWDKLWMKFAEIVAERSHHPDFKVGAVIVDSSNTRMLAMGYNGNHSKGINDCDSLVPGQSGLIHAETNALLKLDYHDRAPRTMYVTLSPCLHCSKLILNSNIERVVYNTEYRDTSGIELLRRYIRVEQFTDI
jgi:dCMP deaminase